MKVIISHDVDHLYTGEHWRKDLILEKFLVRSFLQLCKREISFKVMWTRIKSVFKKRYCRIPEMLEYDSQHGIPSSFFFGMGNILGMSYSPKQAKPWVKYVVDHGFDAGVHAAVIDDFETMKKEFRLFKELHVMDGYVLEHEAEKAKTKVLDALSRAQKEGCKYFTFLFHDIYFNEETFPMWVDFYKWFVNECETRNLEFTSYNKAIEELENGE